MPAILKLIKPGGLLIAQGANLNIFMLSVRLLRSLRSSAVIEMAPYHVMLAMKHGEEESFGRFNLRQQEFSVSEVAWLAPASLLRSEIVKPQRLNLFALRRLSQAVSSIQPNWGDRYFYVGRHCGVSCVSICE